MSRRALTETKGRSSESKRTAALAKANQRRRAIAELKAEARSGRLDLARLLADPRAAQVKVLRLLPMVPRCTLRVALEALLLCQINGARSCGELTATERSALGAAVVEVAQGIPTARRLESAGEEVDEEVELERALAQTRRLAPELELRPSEFAAARTGLEADPMHLRMVDRLVGALRLYVERDDGGEQARVVLEQWIRYRNYVCELGRGERPAPTLRSPAALE